MVRAKRVRREKEAVAWALVNKPRPAFPCVVLLTRIAPSNGLDTDNLAGALKAVRDQVADWLGVDDRQSHVVRYHYAHKRGVWSVGMEWREIDCPECKAAAIDRQHAIYRASCTWCSLRALEGVRPCQA